jgi:phosphohistidine phosphatase
MSPGSSDRRRLTLLRHAKSSWDDPALPDRERPLSARGERDAPRMAKRYRAAGATPDLILTSPAKRALATARIFADALGEVAGKLVIEPELYLATPAELLAVLAKHGAAAGRIPGRLSDNIPGDILIVAHNPGLTELVNRLLPDWHLDNLPTTGFVTIASDAPDWATLAMAPMRLIAFDFPKNREPRALRALTFRHPAQPPRA